MEVKKIQIIKFQDLLKQRKLQQKNEKKYKYTQDFYIWLATRLREYLNYAFQNISQESQYEIFCIGMMKAFHCFGYDIEKDIPAKFRTKSK